MAKEATNPKPSMQREWYCLAVHKNTRERTFEYAGAEKQTAEKVGSKQLYGLFHRYTLPAEDGFGVPPQDSNLEFLTPPPGTDIGITIYPRMTNH